MDVFFIENVGNLVCPAIYDLGQEANVVLLSVTEGEDKPLKYPVMFQKADLVLVTKVDLVPHLDVDLGRIHDSLRRVMPDPRVIEISARTGVGMAAWKGWLEHLRSHLPGTGGAAHSHDHGHDHSHSHADGHSHSHSHGDGHAHSHSHDHPHPPARGRG
jgi:hydrogenase nickel incorporation protein HypB